MNLSFARFFSIIFHPILIPFYSILIILYMFPYRYEHVPDKTWNVTIGVILAMTMLMPAIIVLIMKKLEIVEDYDISLQKQRIFPYLIFFFFYLMTFLTIRPKLNSSLVFLEDSLIASVMLGATISLCLAFFLNNFLKVSVHAMGVTNLFMVVCLLSRNTHQVTFFLLLITLIAIGVTGSARIYLRAHTAREVYYGLFCGFLGQLIAFLTYFDKGV
jgi:membrane-associated phospholipid phosphatase